MSYIDKNELIEFIEKRGTGLGVTVANCCNFKDIINMIPTEDVIPRSEFEKAKQEIFKEAIVQIENTMDLVAQSYKDNEGDEGRQLEYQAQHLGLNKARHILLDLKKKYTGE